MDSVERKHVEKDKVTVKVAFNLTWKKKGKTNLSRDGINKGDQLDLRSGQQFVEDFLCSADPSVFSIVQFLVNNQMRQRKTYEQYDKGCAKQEKITSSQVLPTVMMIQQIQNL